MNALALPAAAAAFWAGLLAWEIHPAWARPWMGMALGLAAIAGAWLAAPRVSTDADPLHGAGLAEREDVSVAAVAAPRAVGGSPLIAAVLVMLGLVFVGAGWSGVRGSWLDGSLMARLAPRRVSVTGALHTDPEAGAFGWHAVLDVTRVEWSGGAASLHASLWLSADERPAWLGARGRRSSRGRDPPARRSRLPRCPRPPGDGRRAERRRHRTPGTVGEPVHPCGAGVPSLRRPVHRALVPGARGGAAPRAGAGGRIAAGRRHDARLPGQWARPPAGGVGRERRHGAGADPRAGLAPSLDPLAPVRSWRRHGRVLRRDDRCRAVRDASRRDGHDRTRRRADRQAAGDRFDPGRGGPRARDPRPVARLVDRIPAVGGCHRRDGGAGVPDRQSGCSGSCRRRSPSLRALRSPRSSA